MTQPTPFDAHHTPPLARSTDPVTSQLGSTHIAPTLGDKQAAMLREFTRCASTANEAAAKCVQYRGGKQESYRKRAGELEALRLIRVAYVRKCGDTKRNAQVYEVVK